MTQTKNYSAALESEEIRTALYEISSQAHLGEIALRSLESWASSETLIAVTTLLERISATADDIAGGATFDRMAS